MAYSRRKLVPLLLFAFVLSVNGQSKEQDRVHELPGLMFEYRSAHYSGFLSVPSKNNLHYWFLESQGNPGKDPLVLWLNGGPGCSSLVGMFTELGPFYPHPDGKHLFENVYSWNKLANILFLESPREVGFSYGPVDKKNGPWNDTLTTIDNADALIEFLKRYPEYKGRDFYISGESYGGVYLPRLAEAIVDIILQDPSKLPINFAGVAIGNGILSEDYQTNSFVNLAYYRGISDYDDTQYLYANCCDTSKPYEYCDFAQYIYFPSNKPAIPVKHGDPRTDRCADIVWGIVVDKLYNTKGYNKYSHEESCYARPSQYTNAAEMSSQQRTFQQVVAQQELAYSLSDAPIIPDGVRRFIDQGAQRNTLSTDQFGGFPCFNNRVVEDYLNQGSVQKAIHVDIPELSKTPWMECNDLIDDSYFRETRDTMPYFVRIAKKTASANPPMKLRFLIYNGDADGVCNYLGDEWFVEDLAKNQNLATITERQQWYYQSGSFIPAPVGFYKTFGNDSFKIDLVTVSGAGHYVPTFRPQPAFQMFGNFLAGQRDYSTTIKQDVTPKQLKNDFLEEVPDKFTRREADQVFSLPGATFDFASDFAQHSGYLQGKPGHYLHYWLIKSQANAESDPLILWLNGGPGCSSLGGALTELGPFRPNPDGVTLSENVYSWNRAANLLFLEAPRNVGFSYQNLTIDSDNTTYSDAMTIEENVLAIKDFFETYPEYKERPFYVMGESYGGVYVPTLTRELIWQIKKGAIPGLNLVGMAVGNGELSAIEQLRSSGPLMYHRGLLDKNQWDKMLGCCGGDYNQLAFCDVTQFVYLDPAGNAQPKNGSGVCGEIFAGVDGNGGIVQRFWQWGMILNAYNIYQDCYQQKQFVFGSRQMQKHKEKIRQSLLNEPDVHIFAQRSVNTIQNIFSTDNQGGFPCFASNAAAQWLNTPDVRKALHIPDYVQDWTDCNDEINEIYVQQFNDTSQVFDDIISSGHPMRLLIYNGDVDLACNFIGDQWFIEKTATRNKLRVSQPHLNWNMRGVIAGYVKQFAGDSVTIDLATVKGAGHLVPTDRPEAALQMIMNFISKRNFNQSVVYSTEPRDLLKQYKVEEEYAEHFGRVSPIDIVANDHPELPASRKYKNAKRSKRDIEEQVPQQNDIPPPVSVGTKQDDKIENPPLPGADLVLTDQYSGYLNIQNGGVHVHYWLVEAQTAPSTSPLVLWLNGGPGCSSLGGLFGENGPFRPAKDGIELEENIFSWNRIANVLYIESPRGVGYSYADATADPSRIYNDTATAQDNFDTLIAFLDRFPEYKGREFYVTGESYGGVYVPTLVDLILQKKKGGAEADDLKLVGFAIGNGILNDAAQINSAVHLMYYRGAYDLQTYQNLLSCCPLEPYRNGSVQKPCDFRQYLDIDRQGNSHPKYKEGDNVFNNCANLINQWGFNMVWNSLNSVYNTYQDCYDDKVKATSDALNSRKKRSADIFAFQDESPLRNKYSFIDQQKLINKKSTDAQGSFPCYKGDATETYLNNASVKAALHVTAFTGNWTNCNNDMNNNYYQEHPDTTPVFKSIISTAKELIGNKKVKKLKMLIYNGDADMACEYLGDEWFVYDLMNSVGGLVPRTEKEPWLFAEPISNSAQYLPRIAGFAKQFLGEDLSLDLVTVKGAGHFVPLDRPGPALQMIKNFIEHDPVEKNLINYSVPLDASYFTTTLLETHTAYFPTRKEMDEVTNLPGLTFRPNFKQYSGYLNGNASGNFLHYWFVEAQDSKGTEPLVLWLTGGPGCSSLGALLGENGPFFMNPDGKTLFENVYSWNKAANVLYIESPRGVGYSYQDNNVHNDTTYNDDLSANDVTWALADFLSFFTEYSGRDFYITGESYGGVYVPTTAYKIILELQKGATGVFNNLGMSLKGFLIGNGYISHEWNAKTMLDFYYFHGLMGRVAYNNSRECCKKPTSDVCDLSDAFKDRSSRCYNTLLDAFDVDIDGYNIYQQCYQSTVASFGSAADKHHAKFRENIASLRTNMNLAVQHRLQANPVLSSFYNQQGKMNYASTDANGGFMCYMSNQLEAYLNQAHVREAIHIPDYVQNFTFCSEDVGNHYKNQYPDMSDVFGLIINSDYVNNLGQQFQILLHNGDNDLVCDFMEAEYFVENLKKNLGGTVVNNRTTWHAFLPGGLTGEDAAVAGWQKQFSFNSNKVRFDLVTVKGSGHFVPVDRPLPGLQLFANFVRNQTTISQPVQFSTERQNLKPQFQPLPSHPAPKHPDTPSDTTNKPARTVTTVQPQATTAFGKTSAPALLVLFMTFVVYRFFNHQL